MAIKILLFFVWPTMAFHHQFSHLLSIRLGTPPKPPRTRAIGHHRRITSVAGMSETHQVLTALAPTSTRKGSVSIVFVGVPTRPVTLTITRVLTRLVWKGVSRRRLMVYWTSSWIITRRRGPPRHLCICCPYLRSFPPRMDLLAHNHTSTTSSHLC